MTMIDRESAEKLLDTLKHGGLGNPQTLQQALENTLERLLNRGNLPDNAKALPKQARLLSRYERFFGIVIQVAPPSPEPYKVEDVARFARFSEACRIKQAETAKVGDVCIDSEEELAEMVGFYRSIASDYAAIATFAEMDNLSEALKAYRDMDTADRDNFGWGAEGFDEDRWIATING